MNCIWITGGGSGVGAALARKLAESGERVVVSGHHREEDLTRVSAGRPGILPFPLDVADSGAVRDGVQRIEHDIAPISLAVLTTGTATPVPLNAFNRERLLGQADAGVSGVLNCLGALVPVLRRRGYGHVAILPPAGRGAGAPLATLIETLGRDLAGSGIRIQVIDPGLVQGPADAILRSLRSDQAMMKKSGDVRGFLKRLLPPILPRK